MTGRRGSIARPTAALFVLLLAGMAIYGCGGSEDSGAEQLAKQEELRAAREEAAQDARQSARIAELEREVKRANRRPADPRPADTEPGVGVPVDAEEPLAGLWRGDAVIRYDSGESDPFEQTIEIESLTPGAVSGYSEAHQGNTTCHGPLTYEGVSEGWYRFSAEEQNASECIDYSEVQLMPDSSGGLSYRETTDVSVSTGRLERVR
ncbi:MAG TPA: hypothetical protein VJU14_10320 [Solirubrobacterales bacterium]|nr:hypothetical protein [Solirubrobacterales bacterium]